MKNFHALYSKIQESLEQNPKTILAIDGMAASGKTTFARTLAEKFDGQVFHMDDFFLPPQMKSKERLALAGENIHWERFLEEVLIPLKEDREIIYQKYDCQKDSLEEPIRVKAGNFIIIEGVYALHPKLLPYYQIKIFMSVDKISQKERLSRRETPLIFDRYLDEWLPLENSYFQAFNIPDICDFILRGQEVL